MSDFQLTWPGPRRPSLLGDEYQLKLDPEIEAEIRAIEARQRFERLRSLWLRPDWTTLQQILPQQPLWLRPSSAPTSPPLVPSGAGPATPRAAEIGDLMKAIWAVPAVQSAANRVIDQTTSTLRQGWRDASTGERALVVGHALLFAGTLAPLLSEQRYRRQAFEFIQGKKIPVPGVRGGSVTVLPRGGAATLGLPWIPGSTIGGGFQRGDQTTPTSWNVMVNIDVAKLVQGAR
jgi:hypothetical protein